jgi:hypothetical protein
MFSFRDKLLAVEHELIVRQWWVKGSLAVKPLKPDAQFRHVEVLEEIAADYRRAIARAGHADNLRFVRPTPDA